MSRRRRVLDDRRYLGDADYRTLRRHVAGQRALGLATGRKVAVRNSLIVETLVGTGLRRAELAALQLRDLRLARGQREVVVRHGKGDQRRVVHISTDFARLLKEWAEFLARAGWSDAEGAPVLPSTRTGGHIDLSARNLGGLRAALALGAAPPQAQATHGPSQSGGSISPSLS